jgi:hypothetical protein
MPATKTKKGGGKMTMADFPVYRYPEHALTIDRCLHLPFAQPNYMGFRVFRSALVLPDCYHRFTK